MDALLHRLAPDHDAGREQLSDLIRRLTVRMRPDLAARLPFDHDEVFLDPLLFAFFTAPEPATTLEQLFVGRMPPERRPEAVPVLADADGIVDLPGIGALHTGRANARLLLADGRGLFAGDTPVPSTMASETVVPGTRVRLSGHIPASYRHLFARDGEPVPVAASGGPRRRTDLAAAFELLERVYPEYASLVGAGTRQVVLFEGARLNSFAAPPAHGCAFLNTAYGDGPVFLFEDLLHQCGHIAFTAMTIDNERLFRVPPDTLLSDEPGPSGEARSAYVVLHAVFTELLMAEGLYRAIARDAVCGRGRHEARGRLAYILRRYCADLSELIAADVLAGPGLTLGAELRERLGRLLEAATPLLRGVDTSGQPYNFSYQVFVERNPALPARA